MISHTTHLRKGRKAKKSYTLSPESVEFLEAMCKKRHAPSVSSILEEILQVARRAHRMTALERAISDYYSSLSSQEAVEHAEWGEFALREFSTQRE